MRSYRAAACTEGGGGVSMSIFGPFHPFRLGDDDSTPTQPPLEAEEETHPRQGDAMTSVSATPNPGSSAAREGGCTCPRMDNHYGRFAPWPPDGWWINEECPMHGREAL